MDGGWRFYRNPIPYPIGCPMPPFRCSYPASSTHFGNCLRRYGKFFVGSLVVPCSIPIQREKTLRNCLHCSPFFWADRSADAVKNLDGGGYRVPYRIVKIKQQRIGAVLGQTQSLGIAEVVATVSPIIIHATPLKKYPLRLTVPKGGTAGGSACVRERPRTQRILELCASCRLAQVWIGHLRNLLFASKTSSIVRMV